MTCILGLVLPRVFSAIRSAILAPTVSISWKWVTPRYSLLYSAASISSLVIVCSPGFILDLVPGGCWLYIWLSRLRTGCSHNCEGFLERMYAPRGVEKRMLIFYWETDFSVCARRLFVVGDFS